MSGRGLLKDQESILTAKQQWELLDAWDSGATTRELAVRYRVSLNTVTRIRRRAGRKPHPPGGAWSPEDIQLALDTSKTAREVGAAIGKTSLAVRMQRVRQRRRIDQTGSNRSTNDLDA